MRLDSLFKRSDMFIVDFMTDVHGAEAMMKMEHYQVPDTLEFETDSLIMDYDHDLADERFYKQLVIYSLYGETLIVTADSKVVLVSTQKVIGELLPPDKTFKGTLKIEDRKYFLDDAGGIISIAPNGSKQKVGFKL